MREEHGFWDDIILREDGTINVEAVYAELHDYATLMEHASRVYFDITCGLISKPNTHASAVISQAEECAEQIKRDEIYDVLSQIKAGEMTLEQALEDYSEDTIPNVQTSDDGIR